MTNTDDNPFELTAGEHDFLRTHGYVVRHDAFEPIEVQAIAADCESIVQTLVNTRRGRRFKAGAYVFEMDAGQETMVKWEGDSDVVHGIEPCAHLSAQLHRWAHDPRFIAPMRAFVRHESPALFTEKLNLKRPFVGGENPLHQDYPYWVGTAQVADDVATAMLMLDDASSENGCLQVVPGSHTQGRWTTRTDEDAFRHNEIDVARCPSVQPVPVELRAGSLVMFGAFLVHRSSPNTSALPRRALLFSYQPPGREHMRDVQRRMRAARQAQRARQP